MCLKVARLFGSTPEFWMRVQAAYDLKKAEQDKKVMQRVARIVPIKQVEEVQSLTPSGLKNAGLSVCTFMVLERIFLALVGSQTKRQKNTIFEFICCMI